MSRRKSFLRRAITTFLAKPALCYPEDLLDGRERRLLQRGLAIALTLGLNLIVLALVVRWSPG